MTGLQWLLLLSLFTAYLLFGGVIFMVLEQHNEILKKEELNVLRQDVQAILLEMDKEFYSNDTSAETLEAIRVAKSAVITRMSDACGSINFLVQEEIDHLRWNYYNSVFFAFTVITTIGYGHLAPTTDWSRIFVIFYALIGIPINGIVLNGLGAAFGKRLVKVQKKSKEKRYVSKFTLILDILFYLIPGMAVFIILPAGIFVLIEKWPFVDGVYYAFITLLTIGFGDFVAGGGNDYDIWMWVYKAGIIIWITFGLGYLVMILGYITKGLTHKKVRIVIENRLNNIQKTRDKLSKDVDYMRRVMNELYMMTIQPVFPRDNDDEDGNTAVDGHQRDRTNSEPWNIGHFSIRNQNVRSVPCTPSLSRADLRQFGNESKKLKRTHSESDLDRIDRCKTFEDAMKQCVLPEDLLSALVQVVNQSVVNDVLDAVDELNELEDSYDIEQVDDTNSSGPVTKAGEGGTHHHHHAAWDLGKLNESDEDVLIRNESFGSTSSVSDTDTEEIVIQVDDAGEGRVPSQNLIDKVNTVIRKISTNSKPEGVTIRKISSTNKPEGVASRKVSSNTRPDGEFHCHPPPLHRNEAHSPRPTAAIMGAGEAPPVQKLSNGSKSEGGLGRKPSYVKPEGAVARKVSAAKADAHASRKASNMRPDGSSALKLSGENQHTNDRSGQSSRAPTPQGSRSVSRSESDRIRKKSHSPVRKISQVENQGFRSTGRYSPLPQDWHSTSATTSPRFERATHMRSSAGGASGGRKISHESNPDPSHKISVETTSLADFLRALDNVHHKLQHPEIYLNRTDDRNPLSVDVEAGLAPSHVSNIRLPRRKRKVGIFHPGFAFENHAYVSTADEQKPKQKPDEVGSSVVT